MQETWLTHQPRIRKGQWVQRPRKEKRQASEYENVSEGISARLKIPKRRAERRVYGPLADCGRQDLYYCEWRKGHEQIELDFAVWIEGLGRFALQVKGGCYRLVDGDWRLQTREGHEAVVSCPLDEAKLSALDPHDDIKERAQTDYNLFVIPVLVLPDMHGGPDIERLTGRRGVYVVWRTGRLADNLEGIVGVRSVRPSHDFARISREVDAVTDGLIRLGETADELLPTRSTARSPCRPQAKRHRCRSGSAGWTC